MHVNDGAPVSCRSKLWWVPRCVGNVYMMLAQAPWRRPARQCMQARPGCG